MRTTFVHFMMKTQLLNASFEESEEKLEFVSEQKRVSEQEKIAYKLLEIIAVHQHMDGN